MHFGMLLDINIVVFDVVLVTSDKVEMKLQIPNLIFDHLYL